MATKSLMFILVPFMNLLISGVCKINDEEFLDKSVVKVIKTESGDIYDCVDFYKQPSLQHPSLKNHNFHHEMRPNSSPKRMRKDEFPRHVQELDVRLKDGGCPSGSVPIRRMEEEDILTQSNLMSKKNLASSRVQPNNIWRQSGTSFAVAQKLSDPETKTFNGFGGHISVYNPQVNPGQYSSAEIMIMDESDMIEVGWTVNPTLYKDSRTRLFLYTFAGNTHCLNSQCGFVIVNTDIPLDVEISPVSTVRGDIYIYPIFVYQDEKNGHWWLEVGGNNTIVGFWPQQFFTGMAQSASYVACGGETYRPPGSPGLLQMGSGYRVMMGDPKYEAFCARVVLVNEEHQVVKATGTQQFTNDNNFTVMDLRDSPNHFVFFGGTSGIRICLPIY